MTSIIQFADVHFGMEDTNAIAALTNMVEALKPDVILLCGDLTQSGKIEEFEAARDWLKHLPGIKIVTPGNHDTPMFGLFQRIFDPFGRYNRFIAPLAQSHYIDSNVSIIPYNTSRGWQPKFDWSLGVIDIAVLKQKMAIFERPDDARFNMIIAHHPLVYPPSSPLKKATKNGPEALRLLSQSRVDAVLTGHIHAPFSTNREDNDGRIISIGAGTLSTRRRDVAASFNHVTVSKNVMQVQVIEWTGDDYRMGSNFKHIK